MKKPRLLLLVLGACANLVFAQAPLAIDPDFRLFVSPQWLEEFEGRRTYEVLDIVLRPDGNYLIATNGIIPPTVQPQLPSPPRSMIISSEGRHIPSAFDMEAGGGEITELPNGQYFIRTTRYNHDGTKDWSFNTAANHPFWDVPVAGDRHVNEDGTVLFSGYIKLYAPDTTPLPGYYGLIRWDSSGLIDHSFTHRKSDNAVFHIFPLLNGQFLLSGVFSNYDGRPTGSVVRIYPDGAIDTTFVFPYLNGYASTLHELPDGRCLLGGGFWDATDTAHLGTDTVHLVRVFLDGSLDSSFNHRTAYRLVENYNYPAWMSVNVVRPLDAGRLLIGGQFTRVDGRVRGGIACVDTSGNLLHDCWASEGLRPTHYTGSANLPRLRLLRYKRLPDGTHWIMGQYKGIVDQVREYPDQVLLSRLYPLDVGLEERREEPRLAVWPNPGSEGFTVGWDAARNGPAQLELRDAQGRLVRTVQATSSSFMVEAGDLPAGLYLLRLTHGQGVYAAKWVKE